MCTHPCTQQWQEACEAAASGDPLIATDRNQIKRGNEAKGRSVFVSSQGVSSNKEKLRRYEEAIEAKERENRDTQGVGDLENGIILMKMEDPALAGLSEKDIKKLKRKQEKEAAKALEQQIEKDKEKRRKEKEERERKAKEEEEEEESSYS